MKDPMQVAFEEAQKAGKRGEVPVGAVIVDSNGKILATEGNRSIEYNDPTGHAEILALRKAGKKIGNYRLPETTIYVTLEPCAMCAAALIHARIKRLVYGTEDPKAGGVISQYQIGTDNKHNHKFAFERGRLSKECANLLKEFFKNKRNR